jgi:hypothetical protein
VRVVGPQVRRVRLASICRIGRMHGVAAGAGRTGTDVGAGVGRAEGVSIRTLAVAVGLSSSRVHQIVADADLDALDAQLGELRAAGWPAPEDPMAMTRRNWTAVS